MSSMPTGMGDSNEIELICTTMPTYTIQDLTEALQKLQHEITPRKQRIEASLQAGEQISEEDSDWLDNAANLVDENSALDVLASTSDYDTGFNKLTPAQKAAIERLHHILEGQAAVKSDGGKRKCMS